MKMWLAMAVIFLTSSHSFAQAKIECRPVTIYMCKYSGSGTTRTILARTYFGCEGRIFHDTEVATNVLPQDCIKVLAARSASEN